MSWKNLEMSCSKQLAREVKNTHFVVENLIAFQNRHITLEIDSIPATVQSRLRNLSSTFSPQILTSGKSLQPSAFNVEEIQRSHKFSDGILLTFHHGDSTIELFSVTGGNVFYLTTLTRGVGIEKNHQLRESHCRRPLLSVLVSFCLSSGKRGRPEAWLSLDSESKARKLS